ncbi:MAG: hypothetical protein GY711_22255 [bacterium]|nr:hypothetical protein [bacterium]
MPLEHQPDSGANGALALLRRRPLYAMGLIALVCLLAFHAFDLARADVPSWGWDESMHAELPAARMALHAGRGEVREAGEALVACNQYPFVFPAVLAATQAVFGVTEAVARGTAIGLWYVFGLLGLALLGLEIARAFWANGERPAPLGLALLLPIFALLSPLVGRYAPTLFLEVPFLVVSTFALRAWLRRRTRPGARAELAAGCWIVAAFFTKFNYGVLLGGAFAADAAVDALLAMRAGTFAGFARRTAWLALLPALAFGWWFALPYPGGAAVAAEHREAFLGFLSGNLEMAETPWKRRLLDWYGGVAAHPVVLAWIVAAGLTSLRHYRLPVTRTLWLLLAITGLPVWLHPFHLDRFLIPGSLAIWSLAALGSIASVPDGIWKTRLQLAQVVGGAAIIGALWWKFPIDQFAGRLGLLVDDPGVRATQVEIVRARWRLGGTIETAGLDADEARALFDAIAADVGPSARVGWLGQSSEVAPAALHLALLDRGGEPERFLRDAMGPMDVTPVPQATIEPLADEELARWADDFDVILITDPPDLKGRASRAAVREAWQVPLAELGWLPTRIAELSIAGRDIGLYACRKQ